MENVFAKGFVSRLATQPVNWKETFLMRLWQLSLLLGCVPCAHSTATLLQFLIIFEQEAYIFNLLWAHQIMFSALEINDKWICPCLNKRVVPRWANSGPNIRRQSPWRENHNSPVANWPHLVYQCRQLLCRFPCLNYEQELILYFISYTFYSNVPCI